MLKIFDKAQWQIDGGIPEELVVNHFNLVFLWLDKHELLSDEGKESEEFNYDELGQDSKIIYNMLIEIRGAR